MGQHATARVGPRGSQVAVPVDRLEVAAVRHYTSRAGDPHRHIHLQINARVQAGGQWRGIDTVAIRDSTVAVNGIGHAAVMGDPTFRAALTTHGFTLDAAGEIEQLTAFAGPFSKRAAQISRHVADYETQWRIDNPNGEPGPGLRRTWDTRAWAAGRPDKNTAVPAQVAHERWISELEHLGYQHPANPRTTTDGPTSVGTPIGRIDRDRVAGEAIARVGSQRSTWNHADLRGEVELLLARAGVIAEPAVWAELAEDVTARAAETCVPVLKRAGVPEHIRALTSAYVIEVEADINGRLALRGATTTLDTTPDPTFDAAPDTVVGGGPTLSETGLTLPAGLVIAGGRVLDECQAAAVQALTGGRALVVVEGAAGAGKTTTLAATRDVLKEQGHGLVVVTPTLKAAKVAAAQTGATASSAAWLAYQYGWRWDDTGTWTRLTVGDVDSHTDRVYVGPTDPSARLRRGDLLVIDEAGMLDQDTARALLVITDECQVRVALLGDPHQLTAVGRGGVLVMAERWTDTLVTLDVIHRFMHIVEMTPDTADGAVEWQLVPDIEYAELSLDMRSGHDPGAVFDALLRSGHVQIHDSDDTRQASIAARVLADLDAGTVSAIVVDTRDQARELNATIHTLRLTNADRNEERAVLSTRSGEEIRVGDVAATRRNDRGLDVANRDTWTVTGINPDGSVRVSGTNGTRVLTADYAQDYLELAYATTAHGVQGDTTQTAVLLLSEHTTAASAYVGMTRGQHANTVHIVADNDVDAREQWVDAFGRGKADLGLDDARTDAAGAASQYATPPSLSEALAELEQQWARQADAAEEIARLGPQLERTLASYAKQQDYEVIKDWFAGIENRERDTRRVHAAAETQLEPVQAAVNNDAAAIYGRLLADWNSDRAAASRAARIVQAGTGRFGRGKTEVADATRLLDQWAAKWEPVLGDVSGHVDVLTGTYGVLGYASQQTSEDCIQPALAAQAQSLAETQHPEHGSLTDVVTAANAEQDAAFAVYYKAKPEHQAAWNVAARFYRGDYPQRIAILETDLAAARTRLTQAENRAEQLGQDPACATRPAGTIDVAHAEWRNARDTRLAEEQRIADISNEAASQAKLTADARERTNYAARNNIHPGHAPGPGRGVSR